MAARQVVHVSLANKLETLFTGLSDSSMSCGGFMHCSVYYTFSLLIPTTAYSLKQAHKMERTVERYVHVH